MQHSPFGQRRIGPRQCADLDIGARKGDPTLSAAAVHTPLHAQGVHNVAGYLDDGSMDQHLRARLIELAHDAFQATHFRRIGHDHQRILAFIGGHHDLACRSLLRGTGQRGVLLHSLSNGFEHLGQLLGITVAKTNDP